MGHKWRIDTIITTQRTLKSIGEAGVIDFLEKEN